MKIYLMYSLIIAITLVLFLIIEDKRKALKLTGVLTILSAFIIIILPFILKFIINKTITNINLSIFTNYIFKKFLISSLIIFIIGIIEILLGKYLYIKHRN